MGEALVSAPWALLVVLVATVALAEVVGRIGAARRLGPAMFVILFGAVLANCGIIPSAANGGPIYDQIFATVIPASIFLVLLEVNLTSLRRAGGTMVASFLVGSLGVMLGVVIAFRLLPMQAMLGPLAAPFAGMYTGTYIGGAANFNAVAIAYDAFGSGTRFTAALVVDNVMTEIWLLFLLLLPLMLARFARFGGAAAMSEPDPGAAPQGDARISSLAVAMPIALAAAAVFVSDAAAAWLAARGLPLPSILILTTLALAIAQLPATGRLRLGQPLGVWGMLLFLACIGASADIAALLAARATGLVLFGFVAVVLLVHLALLLAWGWWRRVDPAVLAMASVTNIGGSTTAFVIAEANRRDDLLLPGILVGALGNALGTYAGFAIAGLLGA
ncbi:MAG: DUF819 family protein [Porphyrobacter sp.]|nr:DUF819 family protein [Porphyrobacter sp.]